MSHRFFPTASRHTLFALLLSANGPVTATEPGTEINEKNANIPLGQHIQQPSSQVTTVTTPRRGMNKRQVETQFGPASQEYAAVGDPPISRWIYPQFVIYFEYDTVLHTVLDRPGQH